jgi:Spy/CpxP family protein refolding chaperone
MNAEQLFLHIIGSDETLTGEQRQQMHVMMQRYSYELPNPYPSVLEAQENDTF